jgi:hypothetical protein
MALCTRCGRFPADVNRRRCIECNARSRARFIERQQPGLCVLCLKPVTETKFKTCEPCRLVRTTAPYVKAALVSSAKQRALEKGLPFDLTINDLIFPEFCPVLGIKLQYQRTGGKRPDAISLDRIVPEKGYVKGNVRVISWRANNLRRDATAHELRLVAEDAERLEASFLQALTSE